MTALPLASILANVRRTRQRSEKTDARPLEEQPEISRGETLGLVGESGCGKSTLGRAVLQLRPALSGRVVFDSEDLTSMRGEALRKMRRRVRAAIADRAALGLPFPHPLPPRGPEMRERGAGTTSGRPAPVRRLPSPADVNKDKRKRKRRE